MVKRNVLRFAIFFPVSFLLVIDSLAQVDVPRKTTTITYPLGEKVTVLFRGTTRFPRMTGKARIKRTKKNGTEIKLSVSKMPRPFELGAGYVTYVLWAISPNGQIDNLGEIKRRGFLWFDSKISVTTPLQTFALIITAEPHFLVSRPSKEVMLENLRAFSRSGRNIETTTSVQYFGNSSDYFNDARTPQIAEINYRQTPISILQAKQAIALAKYAGAERDALEDLRQAQTHLENAENGWKAKRNKKYVDIAARKAISVAVSAERNATVRKNAREKRNEKLRRDAELREAENKNVRASRDIENLKQTLADERHSRELLERDVANYVQQIRELKSENQRLREQNQETKVKLTAIEAKQKVYEAEKERNEKLDRLEIDSVVLIKSLQRFGSVSKTGRNIMLTLAEDYWSGVRVSSFASKSEEKLKGIAEILVTNPSYNIIIESHIDSKGGTSELQLLTEERAQAIADKMMSLGVSADRMEIKGYGATLPIASNSTRANRLKNRRVYMILVPAI